MDFSFFNSLPMLFFIYNENGILESVLGGNEKKRYLNARKNIGKHINEIFEENLAQFILEKLQEVIKTKNSINFNYSIDINQFKDKKHTDLLNEPHWFEVIMSPIIDENEKITKVFWSQFSVQSYQENLSLLEEEKNKLKKLVMEDEFTGLYNRRYLYKILKEKLDYVTISKNRKCSLLSISIDNLSTINSNFGLFEGDKTIEFLALEISKTFKEYATCCRFREGTFIVVLDNKEIKECELLAETFRNKIENSNIKDISKFTVSIGVTEIRKSDSNITDVLERLEEAVYYAKKAGKNKVYTTII